MAWDKGAVAVLQPEDGHSFWQPEPTGGYVTVKVAPGEFPSNLYAAGVQVIPPGGEIPVHAHRQAEELLVVVSGTGRATVDGVERRLEPGVLHYAGRWVRHGFFNDGNVDLVLYFVIWPPGLDRALANFGRPRKAGEPAPEPFPPSDNFVQELAPAEFEFGDVNNELQRGPCIFLGPDEGKSYWQPGPTDGYATVKISPHNVASNHVTVVEQVVPPGKFLPAHGHPRNEELKFVTSGTATATVDGVAYEVGPGSLCVTGRWVEHSFLNTGDDDFTIIAVFMPPALEGLLGGIGRPRTPGEPAPESFGVPDSIGEIAVLHDLVLPYQIAAHEGESAPK